MMVDEKEGEKIIEEKIIVLLVLSILIRNKQNYFKKISLNKRISVPLITVSMMCIR